MRTWLSVLASRLHGWFRRDRLDEDFAAELQAHLAMLAEENVRRGMTADEAARAARVRLGGLTQLEEDHRDRRGLPLLESLGQDVRYALRVFGRNPGFTLVSVLTLAIGIGVNTTVFTLVNAVALKPLPVADPDNLVRIERWFDSGARGDVQYAFSVEEYNYYRAHNRRLATLIAVGWPETVVAGGSGGEILQGQVVSDDYFAGLGINAAVGRTFLPEDNQQPGAHPVIVLGDAFWRRHFQADALTVGRTIALNDTVFTVIGIAPAAFIGTGNPPQAPDFWAPLMMQAQLSPGSAWLDRPNVHRLQLLARLRPDASAAQARAELQVLASQLAEVPETHQPHDKTIAITLQPAVYFGGTDDIRFRLLVTLLMAVVSMILLVACANLANMLLARAAARQKEIGMRLALGASRGRIVRQLLTESVLLSAMGGAAGVVMSLWASHALWSVVDRIVRVMFLTDRAFVTSTSPDGRVLAFGLALSAATGLLFGLSPALRISTPDLGRSLKQEGSTFGDRISAARLRTWLIAAQMAVSTVLLVCAGLFLKGLLYSQAADAGFDTRRVFMVFMSLGTDAVEGPILQKRIVDRLSQAPEIQDVALVDRFPFGGTWSPPVLADEGAAAATRPAMRTLANYVSPSYFRTAGIPIRWGRTFTRAEGDSGAPVAIVSESAARRLWPDADPLGRRLQLDLRFDGRLAGFEVVGVAKDVRSANLSRVDPAYVYLPTRSGTSYNLVIRSEREAATVFAAVRAAVEAVDRRQLPTVRVTSLRDGPMMRIQLLIPRMLATFAGTLAGLALILAAVGIYGVTSYLVSQRTREIGVRMALGATAGDVRRLMVRQGMGPAVIGGALGLVGAAAVSGLLQTMLVAPSSPDLLFGVRAFDPATFAGITVFIAAVAATASYIPARRATRVDPLVALRYE